MSTIHEGMKPMFIRMDNAYNEFVESVMEQFGKTEAEAAHVLKVFKKAKTVKYDAAMGRYNLTHGAFWEADVIDRALATNI